MLIYKQILSVFACLRCDFDETLMLADIQQLDTHMQNRKQREQETRDPVITQLQQMIDSFQSSTDQLANNITSTVRAEVQHQVQMMVGKYVSCYPLSITVSHLK